MRLSCTILLILYCHNTSHAMQALQTKQKAVKAAEEYAERRLLYMTEDPAPHLIKPPSDFELMIKSSLPEYERYDITNLQKNATFSRDENGKLTHIDVTTQSGTQRFTPKDIASNPKVIEYVSSSQSIDDIRIYGLLYSTLRIQELKELYRSGHLARLTDGMHDTKGEVMMMTKQRDELEQRIFSNLIK